MWTRKTAEISENILPLNHMNNKKMVLPGIRKAKCSGN